MVNRTRFLTSLAASILLLGAGPARAELECAQPLVQLGPIRSGVPLSHKFVLVNRGTEILEVTDVRPSCGCLAPRLEKRRYQPGETGTLLLEINTLTQPAGVHSWRTTIYYQAEGRSRELPLYLCGEVVAEISVQPPSLAVYTDASISHEITITDRRTPPLLVRSVGSSAPFLRTHLGELRRNGAAWVRTVGVELLQECPEGHHQETVSIYTSDPLYPELKVPVTIVKRPRQQVSASPSAVILAESSDQPLPARIVLLGAADEKDVVVEHVDCDDAAISCQWAQGPGSRATLKIRVDRQRIPGDSLQSAVHVHLSQPMPQMVTIPVSCSLR
jgi:hypothetical protein